MMGHQTRDVCKASWLQQKIRLTGKPLKKSDCLPEQWFVFCVHNDRIPLLEIYPNEREVEEHRPLKVIDLLECAYLCPCIDDDRSFVIGFTGTVRNPLEFAAFTESERNEWIGMLKYKLQALGCLDANGNIYSPPPSLEVVVDSQLGDSSVRLSNIGPVLVDVSPTDSERTDRSNVSGQYGTSTGDAVYEPLAAPVEATEGFYEIPRRSSSRSSEEVPSLCQPPAPCIYEHIAQGMKLDDLEEDRAENNNSQQQDVERSEDLVEEGEDRLLEDTTPPYSRISPRYHRNSHRQERLTQKPPPVPPRRKSSSEPSPSVNVNTSIGLYDVPSPGSVASKRDDRAFIFPLPQYDQLPPENGEPCVTASDGTNENMFVKSPRCLEVVPPPPQPVETYQRYAEPSGVPLSLEDLARQSKHSNSNQRTTAPSTSGTPQVLRELSGENPPEVPTSPIPAPPLPPRNTEAKKVRKDTKDGASSGYSSPSSFGGGGGIKRRLTLKEEEVSRLKNEMESQCGIRVTVPVHDTVGGIALVELGGHLWVAGWIAKYHKRLSAGFHVGDQVVSVNGDPVTSVKQVESSFRNSFSSGNVTFIVRRLPFGQVFVMKRSENFEDLGIVRKEGKKEIVDVKYGSLAGQAGLRKDGPSFQDASKRVPWVITEINNRPVSLVSKGKGDEVGIRLNAVGRDISVLVQPQDFISALKAQLKRKKNWNDFIVG